MPHISSIKINDKDLQKIHSQLISIFDTAGTNRRSDVLIKEFLTYTEKIMLSKRLAILFMLDEGVSQNHISRVLSVSLSTISIISLKFEQNKYPYLEDIMKKNRKTIWDSLEVIIRGGMPPKASGNARWKWLNEIERRQNRKIFKN